MVGGRRLSLDWIGAVPFLGYVALFLFLPTVIIIAGAFASEGGLTLSNFANLSRPYIISAIISSVILSAVTAAGGAVLGALIGMYIVFLFQLKPHRRLTDDSPQLGS